MSNKQQCLWYESRRKANDALFRLIMTLIGFSSAVLVTLYLWGKVQVDFVLIENQRLNRQRQMLQQEVDDLQIQVNALMRYERIVELAKEQDMDFITAAQLQLLVVDVEDEDSETGKSHSPVRYAGFVNTSREEVKIEKRK